LVGKAVEAKQWCILPPSAKVPKLQLVSTSCAVCSIVEAPNYTDDDMPDLVRPSGFEFAHQRGITEHTLHTLNATVIVPASYFGPSISYRDRVMLVPEIFFFMGLFPFMRNMTLNVVVPDKDLISPIVDVKSECSVFQTYAAAEILHRRSTQKLRPSDFAFVPTW